MNIGIIIGRIGDVDGVALETEKWMHVLKKMGHTIYVLSGRFAKEEVVPEKYRDLWAGLSFFSPECEWEQKRAFYFPPDDPGPLLDHLERTSEQVAIKIFKWIMRRKIDVILAENATALPCHLSMGLGIKKAVKQIGIPVVAHEHDYHWERGDRYKSPFKKIMSMIDDTFPLVAPNVRHAVINTAAKKELKKRFGVRSVVVPNVMDFSKPYGRKSEYNTDMLSEIGLDKKDIPLFQVTRIVHRKRIDTAIELVHKLDDKRLKLVVTGSKADDERLGYYSKLIDQVNHLKIKKQILFGHSRILTYRGKTRQGKKIYDLSDAYAHATACTYFSSYEGFGNAFVESILGKTPIFVNNYKPVYWPDIGKLGFEAVMIEDNKLTNKAVKDMAEVIYNKKLAKEIAEHNYELGKRFFSYDVLEEKLEELFSF